MQFPQTHTKFKFHQKVRKPKGSNWLGRVVGWYSSSLTLEGYAVESTKEVGSVQIYPADALIAVEDGTVEKCCKNIGGNAHWNDCPVYGHGVDKNQSHDKPCCYHQSCGCSCHYKKEERCPVCLAIPCYCKFSNIQQSNDFNRETPKEKYKEMLFPSFTASKEEVKLPEMIEAGYGLSFAEYSVEYKFNQLLRYLASKENEKNHYALTQRVDESFAEKVDSRQEEENTVLE